MFKHNYVAAERDCLAVVAAQKCFRIYVTIKSFKICAHHRDTNHVHTSFPPSRLAPQLSIGAMPHNFRISCSMNLSSYHANAIGCTNRVVSAARGHILNVKHSDVYELNRNAPRARNVDLPYCFTNMFASRVKARLNYKLPYLMRCCGRCAKLTKRSAARRSVS